MNADKILPSGSQTYTRLPMRVDKEKKIKGKDQMTSSEKKGWELSHQSTTIELE